MQQLKQTIQLMYSAAVHLYWTCTAVVVTKELEMNIKKKEVKDF